MISTSSTTTAADQIRNLEKAETVAFLANDFEALNKIWHPEFTVNTPLNRIMKTADIQGAMKAGLIKYSLFERNIEEIMIHDNVVITLGNEVTIPIDKAPMAGQRVTRRCTNIWIKENNEWRMYSRHASNICDQDK
ncbi:MAG: nuclear transport factor 2 family protein [Segetibacter sp.]